MRRHDRGNSLARGFIHLQKRARVKSCRTTFGADPKRAVLIGLQRQHSSHRQRRIVDRLCAASVEFCESRFGAEPHRAVTRLRDRAHAIEGSP